MAYQLAPPAPAMAPGDVTTWSSLTTDETSLTPPGMSAIRRTPELRNPGRRRVSEELELTRVSGLVQWRSGGF